MKNKKNWLSRRSVTKFVEFFITPSKWLIVLLIEWTELDLFGISEESLEKRLKQMSAASLFVWFLYLTDFGNAWGFVGYAIQNTGGEPIHTLCISIQTWRMWDRKTIIDEIWTYLNEKSPFRFTFVKRFAIIVCFFIWIFSPSRTFSQLFFHHVRLFLLSIVSARRNVVHSSIRCDFFCFLLQ